MADKKPALSRGKGDSSLPHSCLASDQTQRFSGSDHLIVDSSDQQTSYINLGPHGKLQSSIQRSPPLAGSDWSPRKATWASEVRQSALIGGAVSLSGRCINALRPSNVLIQPTAPAKKPHTQAGIELDALRVCLGLFFRRASETTVNTTSLNLTPNSY